MIINQNAVDNIAYIISVSSFYFFQNAVDNIAALPDPYPAATRADLFLWIAGVELALVYMVHYCNRFSVATTDKRI